MTAWAWARAAGERSVRTAAQAALALLGAEGAGLLDVDWAAVSSVAGMAAVLSLLTSLAAAGVGPAGPGLAETPLPTREAAIREVLRRGGRE